jgi:hypothetical protein
MMQRGFMPARSIYPIDETKTDPASAGQVIAMFCMGLPIFDIVNGFFNRCRGGMLHSHIFGCGWMTCCYKSK